jgi:uncharacterized protein (DUF305 family)
MHGTQFVRSRQASWLNWQAAALLGVFSSTFSTCVSHMAAGLLGRDPWVDWMSVAAIPARDWAIQFEPGWLPVAIGIAFHQWADFSWAVVFFGLLGRWTAGLRPCLLAVLAVPWALMTSALEWLLLVPVFPFAQPIFTLQQPYWIGFLVHLSSALLYPAFAWIRWSRGERRHLFGGDRFLEAWAITTAATLVLVAALAAFGVSGRAIAWRRGVDPSVDQAFMRHMRTHHEQGIVIARLGASRAQDPHLRALARLMGASQEGEVKIFDAWWASWFGAPTPICSAEERTAMPGYLSDGLMRALNESAPVDFDEMFVLMMTFHHAGAVKMADQRLKEMGDIRLTLMAHAIRHEQQGEIALMRGRRGFPAVGDAIANMFLDNITARAGPS